MSDSTELTQADDIDPSLIKCLNPTYHFPIHGHSFYWITMICQYHQFASDTCAMNKARYVVKRAPVDKHWFLLLEKKIEYLGTGTKIYRREESGLECKLPRTERFWRERARIAGDDSVAESNFGITQNDFVNADGSNLAVVSNRPITYIVSAEKQAANKAEQARLFGESRERTSLGGVCGSESGEDVDADEDVAMG